MLMHTALRFLFEKLFYKNESKQRKKNEKEKYKNIAYENIISLTLV